jgi:hypothetical protein|tara:strand:- start:163 stop:444 length:282 start_codon:yes stop_codon:yes gene_type:complete
MTVTALLTGKTYKFQYNGKWRIALITKTVDSYGDVYICWDFVSGGYRSFAADKISDMVDVTKSVYTTTDLNRKYADPRTRTYVHNNILYAVRF